MHKEVVIAIGAGMFVGAGAVAQTGVVGFEQELIVPAPGQTLVEVMMTLDGADLPGNILGFAGWNIGVDVVGGTIVDARYTTLASPLVDFDDPFSGMADPEISGSTIELDEGLNFLTPNDDYHRDGALAVITIDIGGVTGETRVTARRGAGSGAAFTGFGFAGPDQMGVDFEDGVYSGAVIVPGPSSAAMLTICGALFAARRRRR